MSRRSCFHRRLTAAGLACLPLMACGYAMHAYNVDEQYSPTSPYAEDLVIHTEQHVILGLSGDNDFVDEAHRKLLASCRDGHLFNIQHRFTTELSFLSYENHFTLQAMCQHPPPPPPPEPPAAAAPESAVPAPEPEPPPPAAPKPHRRAHKRHHKHAP